MPILRRNLRVQGLYVGSTQMFEAMNRAIEAGGLKPVIDKVFPFAEAQAAYRHLKSQKHFGKIVISHAQEAHVTMIKRRLFSAGLPCRALRPACLRAGLATAGSHQDGRGLSGRRPHRRDRAHRRRRHLGRARPAGGGRERSGGAGAIGTRAVAKAKPDGQTITFGNNQTHGNNMFMLKEPGYDAVKDFAPLAGAGAFEQVFVVRNDPLAKNIRDLIALAKAKPGELNYGSIGIGSGSHFSTEPSWRAPASR